MFKGVIFINYKALILCVLLIFCSFLFALNIHSTLPDSNAPLVNTTSSTLQLITNTTSSSHHLAQINIPIIGQLGEPLNFNLPYSSHYILHIIGNLSTYTEFLTPLTTTTSAFTTYTFTPQPHKLQNGIYYLQILDAYTNKVVIERKLYLLDSSMLPTYYMSDLTASTTNNTLCFNFDLLTHTTTTNLSKSNTPTVFFTIGEPGLWKKKLKQINHSGTQFSIVENKDFLLNSGTYEITAAIKNPNSIEYEDYKSITYTKPYIKDGIVHKVNLATTELTSTTSTMRYFKVDATCNCGCPLTVSVYTLDDLGITELKQVPSTQWIFQRQTQNFDYELIARVKHSTPMYLTSNNLLLDSSYEVQKSLMVTQDYGEQIKLKPLILNTIDNDNKILNTQLLTPHTTYSIKANQIYSLIVDATYTGINTLYYKAWIVDDGIITSLGDYTTSPNFHCYFKGNTPSETQELFISIQIRDKVSNILGQTTTKFILHINNS